MVNLFLVVIATQFSETKRRETEKIAEERKRYKSSTTLVSTKTESDGCYSQLLKYIIHLCRRGYRRGKRLYTNWVEKRKLKKRNIHLEKDEPELADVQLRLFGEHAHCQPCYHMTAAADYAAPIASPEPSDVDSLSYIGLHKHLNCSPRLFRRTDNGSSTIFVSSGQDETSFNAGNIKNGGLKVSD